jgi:hypothetical protein
MGTENQAISLSGEIERLRFAIKDVKQKIDPTVTYWYQTPGTLNLGGVANTDTFTIYAQNDSFTETVLNLKCDTIAGAGYRFVDCFSDSNGTQVNRLYIDGLGNLVTLGTITSTGQLTLLDTQGIKADKLVLSEAGTGVNHITIQGPDSASTTTHVITLPGSLPGTPTFMLIDQTGQVSYSVSSVAADTVASAMTSVGANAIASTMTSTGADAIAADMSQTGANSIGSIMGAAGANTIGTTMGPGGANAIAATRTRSFGTPASIGGVAISTSHSGTFSTSSTSFVDVTNLSVTITTTGKPIFIGLVSGGGSGNFAFVGTVASISYFPIRSGGRFVRDSTSLAEHIIGSWGSTSQYWSLYLPPSSFNIIDAPPAGTYVYKFQARVFDNPYTIFYCQYAKIIAYEL